MRCLPRSACLGSLSLTQYPNSMVLGECLEIRDNHLWRDSERSRQAGFQFTRENLQSRVKQEDSIIDVENTVFDFLVMKPLGLHVLRPSRLCAQAQSRDDMPFHKQACMEYTQLIFCKLFGMPRERHLACPTRMHGLLSFQGYILNHGLIPPPDHLFRVIRGLGHHGKLWANRILNQTPSWLFNLARDVPRNLFAPLDNPELTIRRRSRSNPTLLNNSKMAAEGPGDLLVPDLKTMEELCRPTLNGRVNGVTDDALHLYLFPHSLTHHATTWFDRLPRNSINTFEQMAKMFLGKYFPPSMVTKLRNEITNFRQHTFYNGLTLRHRDTINAAAEGTFKKRRPEEFYDLIENMTAYHNDWDTSAQRSESSSSITFSSDTEIAALKAKMAEINKNLMRVLQVNQQVKAVTSRCETYGGPHSFFDCPATVGNTQNVYDAETYQAYQAPPYQALVYQDPIHQPQIPQPQVVTTNEFTNFMKANDAILKNIQTNMTSLTNSNLELKNMFGEFMKMNTASYLCSGTLPCNTITNPKEDLKDITTRSGTAYPGPTIPTTFPSPVVECKTEETKDTVHPTNNESTEDVQPLVVPTESLILNSKPVISPIIEPLLLQANDQREKFFQIFKDLNFNISFADALILMPKFGLTIKTLLTNKDKLYFDADARVPLILERSFLKTGRALIDVFEGELTLRVGKEAITFNLDQTLRYSANYNDMTANRIDVIDMACKSIRKKFSVFHIDFLLEEVDAFLSLEDDPISLEVDQYYVDSEGDILLLEAFLNDDPSPPPPNQENYLPQVSKELKIYEAESDKSSIDEPPEVELKDLPPHLVYAFLEGDNKLPVIIAKDLSVKKKTALLTVLNSHKRAIAWKLSDIKGIDPEFYTHKILMEEDFKPADQHHRRVNPKIYEVIKNEVLKLLDDGLIYPISDSPWVSPVYSVPKKGGFTVVENDENELISTRLVTGWRVCIDYCNLNEATRKEHFPLPFMDQTLARLAGISTIVFLTVSLGISKFPSI
uniref:Reverse transcriptase domain-containing protein n=1 Tax=Tanacetum cinerariifolium TaxID=118510 RepID=A0A699I3Y3_TANCI|nr:reverse transcriptase domain-containing protein [Tanacetum cinerariifolium]